MSRAELSLRGLPEWLIRAYLSELGGTPETGEIDRPAMRGDGWRASWSRREAVIPGGSLRLTQFDIVFEGEDEPAIESLCRRFMTKAQRGGG